MAEAGAPETGYHQRHRRIRPGDAGPRRPREGKGGERAPARRAAR